MVMERDMTWAGEHPIQHTDDLSTNVSPTKSIYKKETLYFILQES